MQKTNKLKIKTAITKELMIGVLKMDAITMVKKMDAITMVKKMNNAILIINLMFI
jgi:hypothetical protein